MKSVPPPQLSGNDPSITAINPDPLPTVVPTESVPKPSDSAPSPWWLSLLRSCQHYGVVVVWCSSGILIVSTASISTLRSVNPFQSSLQQPFQESVSRADYGLLEMGMTITEAQAALGRSVESSRDQTSVTYKWVNGDGSGITAVFKGGRLISKQQSGLK